MDFVCIQKYFEAQRVSLNIEVADFFYHVLK